MKLMGRFVMPDNNSPMTLRLDLTMVDITVESSTPENTKNWTLVELTGRTRNKYLAKVTGRATPVGKSGKIVIKNFDGFQTDLLELCLRNKAVDENDTPIPITRDEIEALPASTQQTLFEKAQEISGLNNTPDEDDEEKND